MTLHNILYLIPGLIFPLPLGRGALCLLRRQSFLELRQDPILDMVFEFGLGCGILVWGLFLFSLLQMPFQMPAPLYLLIIAIDLAYTFYLVRDIYRIMINGHWSKFSLFSNSIILFFSGWASIRFLVEPIRDWDVLFQYLFKAKIFFHETIGGTDYFSSLSLTYSHLDYPLFLPLLYDWIFCFTGRVDEQYATLFTPFFLLFFFLGFHQALLSFNKEKETPIRIMALLLTMLYFFTPFFHTSRLFPLQRPEFLLSFIYLLQLVSASRFITLGKKEDLWVSFALIGFLGWVKNEGMMLGFIQLLLLTVLLFFYWRKEREAYPLKNLFLGYGIYAVIYLPWFLFWLQIPQAFENYPGKLMSGSLLTFETLKLTKHLFILFGGMADIKVWGFIWWAYTGALLLYVGRMKRWNSLYLNFSFLLPTLCFLLIYSLFLIKKTQFAETAISGAAPRNSMLLTPVVMLFIGLALSDLLKNHAISSFGKISGAKYLIWGLPTLTALGWFALTFQPVFDSMRHYPKVFRQTFPLETKMKLSKINRNFFKIPFLLKEKIHLSPEVKVFFEFHKEIPVPHGLIFFANYLLYPARAFTQEPYLRFTGAKRHFLEMKWNDKEWLRKNGFRYSVFLRQWGPHKVQMEMLSLNSGSTKYNNFSFLVEN